MPVLDIDGVKYDTEALSDKAKSQIQSIQFVDREITHHNMQLAVLQTSRLAYGAALKELLENVEPLEDVGSDSSELGDTIVFD